MELVKKRLNRAKLQEILDCFTEITGIRAGYFAHDDESIIGKNMDLSAFCNCARQIAAVDEGCRKSDALAFQTARDTKCTYLYQCPMGLWEAVVPLVVKGRLIGYFMLGQVKSMKNPSEGEDIPVLLSSMELSPEKMEEIRSKYRRLPEYRIEQVQAASKMLELIAQSIIHSDVVQVYDATVIEKAREYLQTHYTGQISVKSLATSLDISPSSLTSLFRKRTGTTIMEYVEELRMEKARELLLMTSLSVKEITARCGYEDQNYFSRVFRKKHKSSPVKFREENKSC